MTAKPVHKPINDPEVLAFIAKTEASYPADANIATAEENRRQYDAMCAVFRQPRPASVVVNDALIDSIPVRHYVPAGAPAGLPAVVFAHGGGLVVGSLESHDDVCAEIADATGMSVTAIDYRLAPEHLPPAQFDDVEKVWRFRAAENPRLIAVGDSGGGLLCAALSLRMRRLNGPMPIGQVLIYPGLGGELEWSSYIENAEAPLLRTSDLRAYRIARSGGGQSASQIEELAPLRAASFAGLPPSAVFTADVDPIRDDGFVYVDRLNAAGVPATLHNHEQLVHGYMRGRIMSRRIKAAFDEICGAIGAFARI